MSSSIVLALALAGANTWTVDDDAPADFSSIAAAVFQAASGDVLLVEPGSYGPFVVHGKSLTILGRPGVRPKVAQKSYVIGGPDVTLAGLELQSLSLTSAAGRTVVDDCAITGGDFRVQGCGQVVVARTTVEVTEPGSPGLLLSASKAFLTQCHVTGGQGPSGSPFGGAGGDGWPGVRLDQGSHATIVASHVEGGAAGVGSTDGRSGDGLVVTAGSTAVIRGAPTDPVRAGFFHPCCGGTPGHSIDAYGGSTVVWSGVSTPDGATGPGDVVHVPVEPYLYVTGSDVPGQTRTLRVLGAAGATAIVLTSLAAGTVAVDRYDELLWLDPTALLSVWVTTTPSSASIPLPTAPGLEGLSLVVQAGFPTVPSAVSPGDHLLSNPAILVMRS